MVSTYIGPNEQKWYIPNPSLKRGDKGRRQTRRIRNGMDEAEAGKRIKLCTQCGAVGHNYKKCLQNAFLGAAEAGPSANAMDGAPPFFEFPSASRACPRHSVSTRSGLLTFCRLVEGGPVGQHGRPRPWVAIDNSLITALVDRWRPETHTFNLPCREMAPTLQDVAYLLGLPIAGDAVGPRVVPSSWRDDLELCFAGVDRVDHFGPLDPHPNSRGPAKNWLLQFKATNLHPDIDDDSVSRSLEAYLLCLFGFMMFKNGASNSIDKVLIPYALEIADAPEDAVSFGVGVQQCSRQHTAAFVMRASRTIATPCFRGRPIVDHRGYEELYHGDLDDDGPTMGTLWVCPRERTWAHEQARRTYPVE
ncbi:hypothetical protein U9M48_004402 [Paspalum notatum var. saurae]|uniref:Aminotransferase-like plant mobile domain-containing protein n=1 Tax=Paspalum notatum var. saurae TaxID=547442 RepID=A0AAQ3SLA8_PASNO